MIYAAPNFYLAALKPLVLTLQQDGMLQCRRRIPRPPSGRMPHGMLPGETGAASQ